VEVPGYAHEYLSPDGGIVPVFTGGARAGEAKLIHCFPGGALVVIQKCDPYRSNHKKNI